MMDGGDFTSNGEKREERAQSVVLPSETLSVDILDAVSEKERVKFTVHTKTSLPQFSKGEYSVVRHHEDFVWLHDQFAEDEAFAGYIIPPAPPKPDFDSSREKLQRLGEGEQNVSRDEFTKLKAELEAEYLATFKKTVAMHEVFLQRLASHPQFRSNQGFKVFLEYDKDMEVRSKNKKERIAGIWKKITTSTDEMMLSSYREADDYFDHQKSFLNEYHNRVREATAKSDQLSRRISAVAESYIKVSQGFIGASQCDSQLKAVFVTIADFFEKSRKLEGRVASDLDLKLSDTLRYYTRDSGAAKELLHRRIRALHSYDTCCKTVEKLQAKGKDVTVAVKDRDDRKQGYEQLSENAKKELATFKGRRIGHFKKNFVELVDIQLKHGRSQVTLLKNALAALREC